MTSGKNGACPPNNGLIALICTKVCSQNVHIQPKFTHWLKLCMFGRHIYMEKEHSEFNEK